MDLAELIPFSTAAKMADITERRMIQLIKLGRVPEPVRIGRLVFFREPDLNQWLSGYKKHERVSSRRLREQQIQASASP